jgi:hypothetical protein
VPSVSRVAIAAVIAALSVGSLTSCSFVDRALSPKSKDVVGRWASHEPGAPLTARLKFASDGTFTYSDVPKAAIVDADSLQNADPAVGQFRDEANPISGSGTWTIHDFDTGSGEAGIDLSFAPSATISHGAQEFLDYSVASVFQPRELTFEYGDPDDPLRYSFEPVK